MFERHSNNKDIFEEGYKSLQKGILLFGGSLVVLAILIFVFPALIGYIVRRLYPVLRSRNSGSRLESVAL